MAALPPLNADTAIVVAEYGVPGEGLKLFGTNQRYWNQYKNNKTRLRGIMFTLVSLGKHGDLAALQLLAKRKGWTLTATGLPKEVVPDLKKALGGALAGCHTEVFTWLHDGLKPLMDAADYNRAYQKATESLDIGSLETLIRSGAQGTITHYKVLCRDAVTRGNLGIVQLFWGQIRKLARARQERLEFIDELVGLSSADKQELCMRDTTHIHLWAVRVSEIQ